MPQLHSLPPNGHRRLSVSFEEVKQTMIKPDTILINLMSDNSPPCCWLWSAKSSSRQTRRLAFLVCSRQEYITINSAQHTAHNDRKRHSWSGDLGIIGNARLTHEPRQSLLAQLWAPWNPGCNPLLLLLKGSFISKITVWYVVAGKCLTLLWKVASRAVYY